MLSDAIRATRVHLNANREPVTDGLLETLHAYEVMARGLELELAMLRECGKPPMPLIPQPMDITFTNPAPKGGLDHETL